MKTAAVLLVLLLGHLHASTSEPEPESWLVYLSPKFYESLKAREARKITVATGLVAPDGSPVVRDIQLAPTRDFDPATVEEQMALQVRKLFKNLPVKISFTNDKDRAARHKGNLAVATNMHKRHATVLGWAMTGVDALNRSSNDRIFLYTSTMVEWLRRDMANDPILTKGPGTKPPFAFEPPTAKELGKSLGAVLAHEIGHAVGLRHRALEVYEDTGMTMTPGGTKYLPDYVDDMKWHYQSQLYLHVVLNKLPIPEAIRRDAAASPAENAKCSCHPE